MQVNIKCYASDCSNPVIGQCRGYNKDCGKYYCETHTDGTYCEECGRNKEEEILTRRIYEDYLNTSKPLRWNTTFKPLLIGMFINFIVFMILFIVPSILMAVLGSFASESTRTYMILGWVMLECILIAGFIVFGLIWTIRKTNRLIEQKLAEVEVDKPGFTEFYRAWEKNRNQVMFTQGMKIAGTIVVSSFEAMIDDAVERNRISRGVDQALTKHGL